MKRDDVTCEIEVLEIGPEPAFLHYSSLIRLIDSWLMDMDDGKIIGSVFLDF